MRVIAIASQRGNVGKTSTSCALALGLRNQGKRVLSVDLDPQADLSRAYGIDADAEGIPSTYDVLRGSSLVSAIVPTLLGDVAPASISLSSADMDFMSLGRERLLAQALEDVDGSYDFAIIDTPPNLGVLAWNSLYASSAALVLASPDVFRKQDFPQLSQTFALLRRSFNPSFKVMGVAMTRVSASRENEADHIANIAQASQDASFPLLKTTVREGSGSKVMSEMISRDVSGPRLPRDYVDLTQEVLSYFEGR